MHQEPEMHTPIEFYLVFPVDLYRRGEQGRLKLDYVRTHPPRKAEEVWDVEIKNGLVQKESGGNSTFNRPNAKFGVWWYRIPKGTPLPDGLHLSKDHTDGDFRGHYTIRPFTNMTLDAFKAKLKLLGESAVPAFLASDNKENRA